MVVLLLKQSQTSAKQRRVWLLENEPEYRRTRLYLMQLLGQMHRNRKKTVWLVVGAFLCGAFLGGAMGILLS